MRKSRIFMSLLVALLLTLGLTLPVASQVEPPLVEEDLAPGESIDVAKEVTTPILLPKADIVISVDLTGSMAGELANLKSEIDSIITALAAEASDLNVGIVSHEDYPDAYDHCGYAATYGDATDGDEAFRIDYAVGNDFTAASDAVDDMTLKDGQDLPESYARVMWESGQSDSGIGYRSGAQKILVMFLDDRPHDCDLGTGVDPGRDEAADTPDDIDLEDDAIPAMTGAGVTLLVISSGSYTTLWNDIADDTGGSAVQIYSNGTVPGGLSLTDLILDLISEITTDVWAEVTDIDPGLTVELATIPPTDDPVYYDVTSGTVLDFTETITVSEDAVPCNYLEAEVTFYANSYPGAGVEIGKQTIIIHVTDKTPPEVSCVEGVNPHGNNIPGGKAKGKGQGDNPDGFYELIATDDYDEAPDIYVFLDCAGDPVAGPYASGTVVKFTESPGAEVSIKEIGSAKGQAGAVAWHITLPSEPIIKAVDDFDNWSQCATCKVPPPPK